jgi:site-specific recombinase XerD
MKKLGLNSIEFNDTLSAFKTRLKQEGRTGNGQKSFAYHIEEFFTYLESKGIESICTNAQAKIDDFIFYLTNNRRNKRTGHPIAPTYINKYRDAILRLMEFLTDSPSGESNIVIDYQKPDKSVKDVLSREEIDRLFSSCDNTFSGITDKCMLALLYGCGMRKGEVHSLEVGDIDFSKGLIRLDLTKTKQERDVVMSPSVRRILEEYLYTARTMMLADNTTETYVMVTEQGRHMSLATIPWRLNKMAERTQMDRKLHAHLLRHSIATHLLQNLSLEEVAHFLGHKCLDSTQIYTHIANK